MLGIDNTRSRISPTYAVETAGFTRGQTQQFIMMRFIMMCFLSSQLQNFSTNARPSQLFF